MNAEIQGDYKLLYDPLNRSNLIVIIHAKGIVVD